MVGLASGGCDERRRPGMATRRFDLWAWGLLLQLGAGAAVMASPLVTAQQGGVARWAGMAAADCGIYGLRYRAVDSVCYYPVDIRTRTGRHEIALWDADGHQHLGALEVEKTTFPEVAMELPSALDRYLEVSPEDAARAAKEAAQGKKILKGVNPAPASSPAL